MTNKVKILSSGSYLPKKIILNNDLDKSLETNDEWIYQRTGIKQRHISNKKDNISDDNENIENAFFMGLHASIDCIEKYKIKNQNFSKEDIGLIIVSTITPNKIFPSVAAQISNGLEIKNKNIAVFDVNAVCSGFLYSFIIANNILSSSKDKIKYALIIGSEEMSSILDFQDRTTCVLFGDGAGCILIGFEENHDKNHNNNNDYGLIDYIMRADASFQNILYTNSINEKLKMNGREVFYLAIKELSQVIKDICLNNNIDISDIDYFFMHQSNERIINTICQNLSIDKNKAPISISNHANTSAASIPLLINENFSKLKKGSLIIIAAVGGGMVWGACLFRI
jgi:3-oxoacyl-[acyl-carrier-protein] synthase-3